MSDQQPLIMTKGLITTTALWLAMVGFSAGASAEEYPPDPWLEGESRGYLMALCRMEKAGLITPQQSTEFLIEYREHSVDFNPRYLEGVLRNYIGLKTCSFSKRVVRENQTVIPEER